MKDEAGYEGFVLLKADPNVYYVPEHLQEPGGKPCKLKVRLIQHDRVRLSLARASGDRTSTGKKRA